MKLLYQLQRKWHLYKITEAVLLGFGLGFLLTTLGYLLASDWTFPIALVSGFSAGLIWLFYKGFFKDQQTQIASYLDKEHPELENSSQLLLRDKTSLNLLEQLQQEKTTETLQNILTQVKIPHQIPSFLGIAFLALSTCFLFPFLQKIIPTQNSIISKTQENKTPNNTGIIASKANLKALQLLQHQILITPPTYTQIPQSKQKNLDLKIPIGSNANWQFRFNIPMKKAILHFNSKIKNELHKQTDTSFSFEKELEEGGFYYLEYESQDGQKGQSDYHKIELIPDNVPELKVAGLQAYESLPYDTTTTVAFKVAVKDDYAIRKAHIVTTVAKGDGESVEFKNDTLSFKDRSYYGKKSHEMSERLVLHKLGMEPGDELYIHFEAMDNKQPQGQIGKTFKYILVFEDTTKVERAAFGKLAVDRMPEYFRSQRQIIIDTEKLLAERSKHSPERFREIANNIGIDQKALRLRYGKFLGEESESIIGEGDAVGNHDHAHHLLPPGHEHETPEEHAKHARPKGHEHETEEEHAAHTHEHEGHEHHEHEEHHHGAHEHETAEEHAAHAHEHHEHEGHEHHEHEHKNEKIGVETHEVKHAHEHHGHDHGHGTTSPQAGSAQDVQALIEPYAHIHDVAEVAGFFDESTAAKLRVALTEMWNSELNLRTGEPRKALPYQRKALKLIKEIQQSSRLYVERVGFEPPAIKEREMRYKGELDDIENIQREKTLLLEQNTKNIQLALPLLDRLWQENRAPSIPEQSKLQEAGNELAAIALKEAGIPLAALGKLRLLIADKAPKDKRRSLIRQVQNTFWKLIPPTRSPVQYARNQSRLQELYLKKISQSLK